MQRLNFQFYARLILTAILLFTSIVVGMPHRVQAATTTAVTCVSPVSHSATGNDDDAIRPAVNEFRDAIGALNAPHPINHLDGRRQINWDAAPDGVSAPNDFPGDFFNLDAFPRARGISFTTPSTELQLSATKESGAGIEFDNIDPTYSAEFTIYSAERLFAPIGSNVVDVRFYSPAAPSIPAVVESFGVIFTDVDLADVTKMDFYDVDDNLVHTENVAAVAGSETLSLAGVQFSEPCIYRVRITTGNIGLNKGINEKGGYGYDLVAMDDFIYAEPQPITSCGLPTVFAETGSNPAEIDATVEAYKDALGELNAPAPFNNLDGYRGINWDAAPDGVSAPNDFPGDFFNADFFPRARGISFFTEGTGFQLSATEASGQGIEFNNINQNYSSDFQVFSTERLFTPIGSNVVTANFHNPAQQTTRALTDGFGAVFTDVDLDAKTTIAYYDEAGNLLYKQGVQVKEGDEGLSFAGAKFDSSCISFVKLTNGTAALGSGIDDVPEKEVDLVVMDDFIYGEPTVETVCGTPEIFTATGADDDAIRPTVNAYRDALGALNDPVPQNFPGGRRQINWDAAPDGVSAPNPFAGNFFNFNAAPRARGIEFETNGDGFQLSATEASGAGIEFDNINPNYSETFNFYSAERLFTAIGSNQVDARFFNPATQVDSALTTGFGAVFTDVDLANVTALRYYDTDNKLVYAQSVPAVTSADSNVQESLSFAGLKFDTACIGRVRLVNGNTAIEAGVEDNPSEGVDLVVMDDFIYGEPQPATININAALNLVGVKAKFDRSARSNAPFGVLTIKATFKNVGTESLKNLSYEVTELNNGNVLLNAASEVRGVGASLPLSADALGADRLLTANETFNVDFEIGLNQLRPFTLLVSAFGTVGADPTPSVELGWNYLMNSNPEATSLAEQS